MQVIADFFERVVHFIADAIDFLMDFARVLMMAVGMAAGS
jgi:hypothetical protein